MEITIKDIGITDATATLENLSLAMQDSAERGNMPSEIYASAFEVIAALASAIRTEAEVARA